MPKGGRGGGRKGDAHAKPEAPIVSSSKHEESGPVKNRNLTKSHQMGQTADVVTLRVVQGYANSVLILDCKLPT